MRALSLDQNDGSRDGDGGTDQHTGTNGFPKDEPAEDGHEDGNRAQDH